MICKICNNHNIETKIKNIFICGNCFHIIKLNDIVTKNIGNICILQKENKNYIWVNMLHCYDNPHIIFKLINELKNEYKEFTSVFIKLPYINGKLSDIENSNYIHYFNINSMKILCEFHNFNIIDLYKSKINNFDELFYIFELQNKNQIYNNKSFDIYKYIYDELTNDLYDICNYI